MPHYWPRREYNLFRSAGKLQGLQISFKRSRLIFLTTNHYKAIRTFEYRVIVITPEQFMKPDGEFEKLLMNPLFASRIISIVIDGAHCLTGWGEFHPEYERLGRLRYVLPGAIPFLVTSPAFTKSDLNDVIHLFHMHMDRTLVVRRSSDLPNIKIGVKKIIHPMNSFADLAFLIPAGFKVGDPPPSKFLVFFDDIDESIAATRFLWRCLPHELRLKIKWYNPDMSATFKKTEVENLLSGETWGLCTAMSFGMVRISKYSGIITDHYV